MKELLVKAMDRPGGRSLLSALASRSFSQQTGQKGAVFFEEGLWAHAVAERVMPDGLVFTYRPWKAGEWLKRARETDREAADFWFHLYTPSEGDTIVDVGSGDGCDLPCFSASVGKTGRVLAIEAHPFTFRMLQYAVKRNHLDNLTCVQMAVMAAQGDCRISNLQVHEMNRVDPVPQPGNPGGLTVPGNTLAHICEKQGIEQIDLLKMNIEGAEQFAISGMGDVLKRTRFVCIACHDFLAEAQQDNFYRTKNIVCEFLEEQGFRLVMRAEDPRPYVRDHVHGVNKALVEEKQGRPHP